MVHAVHSLKPVMVFVLDSCIFGTNPLHICCSFTPWLKAHSKASSLARLITSLHSLRFFCSVFALIGCLRFYDSGFRSFLPIFFQGVDTQLTYSCRDPRVRQTPKNIPFTSSPPPIPSLLFVSFPQLSHALYYTEGGGSPDSIG